MSKQSLALCFRYYIWLADTIYSAGHITRKEINQRWQNSSLNETHEAEIPERTFHRWRQAIQDVFSIDICCSRSTELYYIDNAEDMKQNGLYTWLINTFAVGNLLADSKHMSSQILYEKIPGGQRFLTPILEAMRDHRRIMLTYRSFHRDEPSTFAVSPYCVKVYAQRWYMVGVSEGYENPRIYALDRVVALASTEESYTLPEGFNAEEYFSCIVGVMREAGAEPETVRIRIKNDQAHYLRTLPIHDSQKELSSSSEGTIFEYFLIPNYEFEQELFKHMDTLEVLYPEHLREKFRKKIINLNNLYRND